MVKIIRSMNALAFSITLRNWPPWDSQVYRGKEGFYNCNFP